MTRVIAIASCPGGGKSSLVKRLLKQVPNSLALDFDDYQSFTQLPMEKVRQWFSDGGKFDDFNLPELEKDLRALKMGLSIERQGKTIGPTETIFLETHFGRQHQQTGKYIDQLIWVDVPLDIALARNVQNFCQLFKKQPQMHAQQINWLEHYLSQYINDVREMLLAQKIIAKDADVIVEGCEAIEVLEKNILNFIGTLDYEPV